MYSVNPFVPCVLGDQANETQTPLVPMNSGGPHLRGATYPVVPEAIRLDLSAMKRILRIDCRNRLALIRPGVTGPGQLDFYKSVSAAQGSMGIVTWASVKCEVYPQARKLFLFPLRSSRIQSTFL